MSEGVISATAPPFGFWERMLAGRYLRARRSQGGVALIALLSFIAITAAVAVLIATMSVMNGFRAELLGKMLGFQGHAFVTGALLDGPAREAAVARVRQVPEVVQAMPVIEAQAIAMGPLQITGAMVRGLTPRDLADTPIVAQNIASGTLKGFGEGEYGGDVVVVGARLAEALGVGAGDPITLISPAGGATAFGGTPLQKTYTVGATFMVGMSQYDQLYIYMPLQQAQLFFGRSDTADAIEVKVADPDRIQALMPAIGRAAGPEALVTDWTQRNSAFWGAIHVERIAMRLILGMLIVIAALNIISSLVMLVKNKSRDVAILRTMGAGRGAILRIFFMTGVSIGALGTLAGVAVGVLFATFIGPIQRFVEWSTGTPVFASDVYFLSRLPAKVDWLEVSMITLFSLGMSCLWTLFPAWWASRLDPVEALRYE